MLGSRVRWAVPVHSGQGDGRMAPLPVADQTLERRRQARAYRATAARAAESGHAWRRRDAPPRRKSVARPRRVAGSRAPAWVAIASARLRIAVTDCPNSSCSSCAIRRRSSSTRWSASEAISRRSSSTRLGVVRLALGQDLVLHGLRHAVECRADRVRFVAREGRQTKCQIALLHALQPFRDDRKGLKSALHRPECQAVHDDEHRCRQARQRRVMSSQASSTAREGCACTTSRTPPRSGNVVSRRLAAPADGQTTPAPRARPCRLPAATGREFRPIAVRRETSLARTRPSCCRNCSTRSGPPTWEYTAARRPRSCEATRFAASISSRTDAARTLHLGRNQYDYECGAQGRNHEIQAGPQSHSPHGTRAVPAEGLPARPRPRRSGLMKIMSVDS